MGLTKEHIYSENQKMIAQFAKALGHPARVAILEQLFKAETCICADLVDVIGLAQPTISQHLKELKQAGLIQSTQVGKKTCLCLHTENFNRIKRGFAYFFNERKILDFNCC